MGKWVIVLAQSIRYKRCADFFEKANGGRENSTKERKQEKI